MQLTVRDVAKLLNVSEKTVYRWVGQGTLPSYRVNEQYRFNRAELLEWATSHKVNVAAEIFEEPESDGASPPALSEAIRRGGIHYRVSGTGKQEVLRGVVEVLRLPESVDRDFLLRVLLAREELASTGIGDGIAIPHVRNPIILHVHEPTVALCFLQQPVDFGALDGQPVSALFTLISPTVRAHLHLLSRMAFVLRHPEFRAAVKQQAAREELTAALRRAEEDLKQPVAPPDDGGR
jgi:PTS system nitrogen regulatory IIA component